MRVAGKSRCFIEYCSGCDLKAWSGQRYYFVPVPARKKPQDHQQFQVGDRVSVTLHTGRIVDGTVRAVGDKTDGVRLQVDYGTDETALVELWRVHPK